METVQVTKEQKKIVVAMKANRLLQSLFQAMVEFAQSGDLSEKPERNIAKATHTLPEPKTAPTRTIEQMKEVLRAADCLYDDPKRWRQLGATKVPRIPDTVIQEAYEKGGRVILRCSSISKKADALRIAGHNVDFEGTAEQDHYAENVSKPEWIVVQSHIDTKTVDRAKRDVVTTDKPAPTPEDWFSAIAYARLDGVRQPKGCENLWAFTTESGTVVGSSDGRIVVDRHNTYVRSGGVDVGAARFGPPRN